MLDLAGIHSELEGDMRSRKDHEPYYSPVDKAVRIEAELDKFPEISFEVNQQMVSSFFSRPNKEGGLRVIFDLSDLNKHR